MLKNISREAAAYDAIYHGRTLVLKVSGAEIGSADFPLLAEDIRCLVQKGVRIVLAFGGGNQISTQYGKPRQKIDGVGVTNDDVLQNGVLPAYHDIRAQLSTLLPEGIFVEPEQMQCDLHPNAKFGLVGIPKNIVLPDTDLSFVGFVGKAGKQEVNVNADDIAMQLVTQYHDEVEELIFLTGTGGMLNGEGNIVSLLTTSRIDNILQGLDKDIIVDGGMRQKMQVVRRALDMIAKVVLTKTSKLREEIEQWMGSGTLAVNENTLSVSPLRYMEHPIFDHVVATYTEQGTFRPRTPEEIDEMKTQHRVLRAGNSPLGGFSVIPRESWSELSTVWAGSIGNGIGQMLLDAAVREAGRRKMYALAVADDAIQAFSRHPKFDALGSLSEAQKTRMDELPNSLAEYDTAKRDPQVFVKKNSA